jgi:hypothetical protein
MTVVPEAQRLSELQRVGVSELIIRLSAGEPVHDLFRFRCESPPYAVYHGASVPVGPTFVPLWECCDSVTGVWERDGRLGFLEFSIEDPREYRAISNTEQGLLADLFLKLYEDRDDLGLDDFREPARLIGFRFLDEMVTAYEGAPHATFEAQKSFQRDFLARIDRLVSGEPDEDAEDRH